MLQRITLANFKNWRELDIDLAPITLLFGTNSAGKTGVLQSLLMLKQTASSRDPKQHLNFGGGDRDFADFGSYQDLVFGHDTKKQIELSLSWDISHRRAGIFFANPDEEESSSANEDQNVAMLSYDICWRLDNDLSLEHLEYAATAGSGRELSLRLQRLVEEEYRLELSDSLDEGQSKVEPSTDDDTSAESTTVGSPLSCYMLPFGLYETSLKGAPQFPLFLFSLAFEELMGSIYYLGPLRQYPRRYYQWTGEKKSRVIEPDGADTIATLVSSERDDKSLQVDVARWLGELDLVEAFKVKPTDRKKRFYEVSVKVDGIESALVDVGFGVSQVLPVVTLLFSVPRNSIVLLEQPELHLHPNAQSLLADLMLHVAEKRNLQLIVESHSEHIVRRLQRRIAEANPAFATPENIKMYYCQSGETGSTISEVDVDRFGQISDWPEKFMGDISGDIHSMAKAALNRRRQELERVGSGG